MKTFLFYKINMVVSRGTQENKMLCILFLFPTSHHSRKTERKGQRDKLHQIVDYRSYLRLKCEQ